jgi:hypothetical protein
MQTIEQLKNNITATIFVAGPGLGNGVRAFMTGRLSISAANGWDSFMNSGAQDNLDRLAGIGKNVASNVGAGGLTSFSVKTRDQTRLSYTGPQRPEFSMEILLLNTSADTDTVIRDMKLLYSTVMPSSASVLGASVDANGNNTGVAGQFYDAPMGYAGEGVMSVGISSWFQAHNLVMTSVNITPSMSVDQRGYPIYANGSIAFQPAIVPTYSEFLRYFQVKGVTNG